MSHDFWLYCTITQGCALKGGHAGPCATLNIASQSGGNYISVECPSCADLRARVAQVERERDEARVTVDLIRQTVAEMKADATRPRGGQSVSPRRMPVPLSVVLELERLLEPRQARYTYEEWLRLSKDFDAARARVERLERALRGMLDNLGCGCCAPNGYCDAIDAARAAIAKAEGGGR